MSDPIARLKLPALGEPLPRPTIDAHTHLDAVTEFCGLTIEENLELASQVGVNKVVQIGCDLKDSEYAALLSVEYPQVIAAVALHPNTAAKLSDEQLDFQLVCIEALVVGYPRVRAIGETGLDFFRTKDEAGIARQFRSFKAHIELAKKYNLTLAIHDRDAHEEVLATLDEVGWPQRVIFHCFSADVAFAKRALEHNSWLSFAGNVTYPANQGLRDAFLAAPADRVLVETDAPYLTAVPNRGKPNASYLVADTVRYLADLAGWQLGDACDQFAANAEAAYGGSATDSAWGAARGCGCGSCSCGEK